MLIIPLADSNILTNVNNGGSMNQIEQKESSKNKTSLLTGIATFFASVLLVPNVTGQGVSGGLEEIVVTAQRREQSLQEVPISVQVFSGDELKRSQILDMEGLKNISASVTFDTGIGLKTNSFGIRGIATNGSNTKAFQSSVGIILDGVAFARPGEFVRDLGDVERVEVLRGPQGTLFGKNATAGVLNIVTKGPTEEPDGFLETSISTDAEYLLRGAIGGPIANRVRGRIYASWRDQNPTIENINPAPTAHDLNGREVHEIAGKLDIDLADNVLLRLSGDWSNINARFASQMAAIAAPGQERKEFPILAGDRYRTNRDGQYRFTTDNYGGSAILEVELNDAWSLVSTTGYRYADNGWYLDQDTGKCGIECIGSPAFQEQGNTGGIGLGSEYRRMDSQTWHASEEIQLQYTSDNTSLITGVYYEHVDDFLIQTGPSFLSDNSVNADFIPDQILDQTRGPSSVVNDTYSIFGDITRKLTDTFSVFGGLRYSHEKLEADLKGNTSNFNLLSPINYVSGVRNSDLTYIRATGDVFVVPNVLNQPLTFNTVDYTLFPLRVNFQTKRTFDNVSGRIGLSWQPTDDSNYYMSLARGYKGPSADMDFGATIDSAITDEELATSIEGGFKGTLADRHTVSFATYYTKIDGLQANAGIPGAFPARTVLRNIGDLESYGAEADFVFRVTDNFNLNGSIAYTHSRMQSGLFDCYVNQTAALGCNVTVGTGTFQSLEGKTPVTAPDWKYRIAGYYFLPLADMPWDGYVNVSWNWQDRQQYDVSDDPNTLGKAYGLLDFAVGVESKSGRYNVELFGKNARNQWYPGSLSATNQSQGLALWQGARGQHSYFGMRVRVNLF